MVKMEKSYGIKLNLTGNYLEFPKFINEKGYKDIIFDDKNPFFKKVIIKNTENKDLPSVPVAKTPCSQCWGPGFNSWSEN